MCECPACPRLHVDQVGQQGRDVARFAWKWIEHCERVNGARPDLSEHVTSLLRLLSASASGPSQADDFWVTTTTAACLLGVSERQVRRLAACGRLPGAHAVGRDWRIPRESIEFYRSTRAAA